MKLPLILSTSLLLLLCGNANSAEDSTTESAPAAATEATDAGSRVEPDPESQRIAALAQALQYEQAAETEVIWLEAPKENRLALYRQTGTADSHGGIMIFHDIATSPDWPTLVHPLRTALTDHGWNTLAISLPAPSAQTIPERTIPTLQNKEQVQKTAQGDSTTETSANNTAANEGEAAESYLQTFSTIAAAGSDLLYQKGHDSQIVIGIGDAATWATGYVLQNQPNPNLHLVIINPSQATDSSAPKLAELLAKLKTPTLDLYFSSDNQQLKRAKLRKRITLRNKVSGYQQVKINQRSDDPKKSKRWLSRQLHGLLYSRIIKNAAVKSTAIQAQPKQVTPGS